MDLYKGVFNWAGENYTMYTHAISSDKAFFNFINQLSKKLYYIGNKRMISQYFNGSKDNYYLTKEKDNGDGDKKPKENKKADVKEKTESTSKDEKSNMGVGGQTQPKK